MEPHAEETDAFRGDLRMFCHVNDIVRDSTSDEESGSEMDAFLLNDDIEDSPSPRKYLKWTKISIFSIF